MGCPPARDRHRQDRALSVWRACLLQTRRNLALWLGVDCICRPWPNILLAAFFAASYYLIARPLAPVEADSLFSAPPPMPITYLAWTLWVGALLNGVLAILKILAAYPLDGGMIARHLLARRLGEGRAARIVGFCGVVLSILRFAVILPAAVAGILLWLPPSLKPNWRALRGTGRRRAVHAGKRQKPLVTRWNGAAREDGRSTGELSGKTTNNDTCSDAPNCQKIL